MPEGDATASPWEPGTGAAAPPPYVPTQSLPPDWSPPAASVAGGWPAPEWAPPPPPPTRNRRRRLLVVAIVALLAAGGATAGAFVLFGSSAPKLTFQGKHIDHPDRVLAATETKVRAAVQSRHGVQNNSTRCYFARPKQPAAGAAKSDVDPALSCGPVLFVDGDAAKTYLSYTLIAAASGGSVKLSTEDNPQSDDPAAVPANVDLVRPDSKTVPRTSTLTVPQPPAAAKDALVADDLGKLPAPKQLDSAFMVSLNTGVQVQSLGIVPRYGHGDDARSAPPGEQLIAFQLVDEPGEMADKPASSSLRLSDAHGSRAVPDAPTSDQYDIVAEPVGATAQLVLKDAGYTQTIALPSGKLGSGNLAVLTRQNRIDVDEQHADVGLTVSGAGSGSGTLHAMFHGAKLEFWYPGNVKEHASKPSEALLFVDVDYTDPQNPGSTYGFDPGFLTLKLPNGAIAHARNVATDPNKVVDVFEVPASLTSATLLVNGSFSQDGLDLSVTAPASFRVSFPAG